ncbi:MAG: hypothetical protein SFY66_21050 [Oculatellaceae cyanobacterium bins.114]|nr:hypothetical protein [Oculatellaceae cyanobacterium bins.114]
MHSYGIYTLANDAVYDQLVALLNSIEMNVGLDIPVCIIPFDDRLERVKHEISSRANVVLFEDTKAIARWEKFAQAIWAAHPIAQNATSRQHWGLGHHRKLVAFDGMFDKFVFYDADSLAMKPINDVFKRLQTYDFVFDDWEHKKSREVAALNISLIEESGSYTEAQIRPKLHCSSFFGSKKGIFDALELDYLRQRLIDHNEITWVPRWWDDAFLFTYMTLRSDRPLFNFTLSPNSEERTGNCANADPFVNINHVLYNKQGLKPIHRIHYMGYSYKDFARLTKGEDMPMRYKSEFLHYRFLKQPELKPTVLKQPSVLLKVSRHLQKLGHKTAQLISQHRQKELLPYAFPANDLDAEVVKKDTKKVLVKSGQ